MKYINDIYINFNKKYYEFFEWNKKDKIIHLKKTPILKVSTNCLTNIVNHHILVNLNNLREYINKAELYGDNKKYNFIAITNGIGACVINLNNKGKIIKISSLVYEDEENILDKAKNIKPVKLDYQIYKKEKQSELTRLEKEKKQFLLRNLKNISPNKLKYLYFDCFNKEESNITNILSSITNEIKKNNLEICDKCYSIFDLIYEKNK